jgi:hypothetical protein
MEGTHMFKVSKKQNRILLGLAIAALVGIFFYQVAYGSNESSYKWGFIQGKSEWSGCSDADGNCATGLNDCQSLSYSVYNYTTGYYNAVPNSAPLSNHTACIDGYVNGWNHVCDHKIARSWPNIEIICPMTFGRAAMNDTIPGSSSSTGWHYDARNIWQNTTDNGLPETRG